MRFFPWSLLDLPRGFDLFQRAIGASRLKRTFVTDDVAPLRGERLLDVGCGTGALVPFIPPGVIYVGIDISNPYVSAARRRYGDRATFITSDASEGVPAAGPFDVACFFGVLHHLDDDVAMRALRNVRHALRDGGRLVALEPVIASQRSRIEALVMNRDRGRHIRRPAQYEALLGAAFDHVEIGALRRPLRIPYAFASFAAH